MEQGEIAPVFKTTTESGEPFDLTAFRGQKVVLYFYPKDDTPGCTQEACSLRDAFPVFEGASVRIFGISGGTAKSHQKFKAKNSLPFPLLMDENFEIARLYGVYVKKSMYGKEYMGIERTTFLIDENGRIAGVFGPNGIEKVDTKRHAEQVISYWKLKM
ncbi:MAG: peroxiredoxin [Candidatus Thorarchaeota archaeon]